MNFNKTISVAMATYNGEQFIKKQLDSILTQTYLPIEIIICDDCSTDNTWNIITEYSYIFSFIKIFKNDTNLGFKKNFEKAINKCSGEYIALADQDDIWLPNHLSLLVENIGENSVVCGDAELIDNLDNKLNLRLSQQNGLEIPLNGNIEKAFFIFYNRGLYQGASMLFSKKFAKVALPIPDRIEFHDVWFSFLACFMSGFKYLDIPITLYRQHNSNASGNHMLVNNKLYMFFWHLKTTGKINYRHDLIKPIKQRTNLDKKQIDFLEKAERYCVRRNSRFGRFLNSIFEIRYFKYIYGSSKSFIYIYSNNIYDRIKTKLKKVINKLFT